MVEGELTLSRVKQTLDRLSEAVSEGAFPTSILKDLKLSVDHLRLTLWATIAYQGKGKKGAGGADFGLSMKLAEFRIKRLLQMLADLQADFEHGDVAPSNPDLFLLASALQSSLQSISKLTGRAN